jgi:hypothetical protein
MNDLRTAAKQALEALERYRVRRQHFDLFADEINNLRAALEQDAIERDALRADAERYRYVLKHARRIDICGLSMSQTSMCQLSARIDAARRNALPQE